MGTDISKIVEYIDGLPYEKRRIAILKFFNPAPKRFLYKYRCIDIGDNISKDRAIDLFLKSRLWLSSPNDFNDPFEMCSNIEVNATGVEKRDYFKRIALDNGFRYPERKKFLTKMITVSNSKLVDNYKISTKKIFNKLGVYCFTYDPRNILMWSHYANDHKGICVQFEKTRDFKVLSQSVNVNYSNIYPKIDFVKSPVDDIKKTILSKFTDWDYEQECRMLFPGKAHTYIHLNEDSVVGIIFGCKSNDKTKNFIKDLLLERKKMSLSKIKLYDAYQHDKEFKIYIKKHHV